MPTPSEERFLAAMRESYRMVQACGPRSPEKIKVLHGWVQEELRRELGDAYALTRQSPVSASEASVEGMYYGKNVDVLVSRGGQELGVVSVKFVITNISRRIEFRWEIPSPPTCLSAPCSISQLQNSSGFPSAHH